MGTIGVRTGAESGAFNAPETFLDFNGLENMGLKWKKIKLLSQINTEIDLTFVSKRYKMSFYLKKKKNEQQPRFSHFL